MLIKIVNESKIINLSLMNFLFRMAALKSKQRAEKIVSTKSTLFKMVRMPGVISSYSMRIAIEFAIKRMTDIYFNAW